MAAKKITQTKKVPVKKAVETKDIAVPDQPQMRCGYGVALTADGQLIFQKDGDSLGVVELLGLHAYAGMKIQQLAEENTGLGQAQVTRLIQGLASGRNDSNKL